jgi:NADPH-dependent 2,4-dienoyl-CoA reductase/sulfur reductase-like enzyme
MNARPVTRRDALLGVTVSAGLLALPSISRAQSAARAIVVGGGFGGTACARALKRIDTKLQVTLIEPNKVFTSCPFSNEVIAGLREIEAQQFGYEKIAAEGVGVIAQAATKIDPSARSVTLADGTLLPYDRLVLAPGIDFQFDALPGYDEAASARMPHAWKAGEQTVLLRRQLEAMDDGGVVALAIPANPSRCPPAAYERASLIAHYLKTKKPKSKVIVLDAKESFTMQKLFEAAWAELYPGMVEWVGLSNGGALSSVDAATKTFSTDFDKYKAAVGNVIPPQKAGRVAELARVADRTGWCPVDPVTFESKLQKNIHVVGDAAIAGAMPRSASAAHSQAQICASAIATLFAGKTPAAPTLTSSCYSLIAPDYAISQKGTYRPADDQYTEAEGGPVISPQDAPRATRKAEAEQADTWFRAITGEVFG